MALAAEYVQVTLQLHWATARPIQYIFLAELTPDSRLRYVVPESRIVEELWNSGISAGKISEGIETLKMGSRFWSVGLVSIRSEFMAKFHDY